MNSEHPRCRNCGKKINRKFRVVTFGPPFPRYYGYTRPHDYPLALPRSRREARKICGLKLYRLNWTGGQDHEPLYIYRAAYWAGEYADPYFCRSWWCRITYARFVAETTDIKHWEKS